MHSGYAARMATALFVVFWVAGLVGTFVPVLPAAPLILVGALLAAWLTGFAGLSWPWLALLLALGLAGMLLDNLAAAWGARRFGGSRSGLVGALAGGVLGVFFFPLGLLLGPLLGALAGELLARRTLREASRSAGGAVLGLLAGTGAKLALHLGMGGLVLWRLLSAGA